MGNNGPAGALALTLSPLPLPYYLSPHHCPITGHTPRSPALLNTLTGGWYWLNGWRYWPFVRHARISGKSPPETRNWWKITRWRWGCCGWCLTYYNRKHISGCIDWQSTQLKYCIAGNWSIGPEKTTVIRMGWNKSTPEFSAGIIHMIAYTLLGLWWWLWYCDASRPGGVSTPSKTFTNCVR